LKDRAPPRLRDETWEKLIGGGQEPQYLDLKAIVKLINLVLTDGGVGAALEAAKVDSSMNMAEEGLPLTSA
ncbi:hypothetical protein HDU93_002692, partial [Gonapodya sp. JEL0774]